MIPENPLWLGAGNFGWKPGIFAGKVENPPEMRVFVRKIEKL
jgi:hypothetical protein